MQVIYQNKLDTITVSLVCQDDGGKPMVVLTFDSSTAIPPLRIALPPSSLDFVASAIRDCERILYHQEVEYDKSGLPHAADED